MNTDAINTLTRKIDQAQGVLASVIANGLDNDDDRFLLNHKQVMSALWALEDLLEQARVAAVSATA